MGFEDRELSILLADDVTLRELNRRFRNLDRPTDVLSFPMDDPILLGDVAISLDRVRAQAPLYGVSEEEELLRLLVHGILHLAGYDHEKGGPEAQRMMKRQEELVKRLMDKVLRTRDRKGD